MTRRICSASRRYVSLMERNLWRQPFSIARPLLPPSGGIPAASAAGNSPVLQGGVCSMNVRWRPPALKDGANSGQPVGRPRSPLKEAEENQLIGRGSRCSRRLVRRGRQLTRRICLASRRYVSLMQRNLWRTPARWPLPVKRNLLLRAPLRRMQSLRSQRPLEIATGCRRCCGAWIVLLNERAP